jgi:DNA-binding IscR family transcriptional regulator
LRLTGLIEARSGPGGGWAIARDPAEVRLGALYRRVAGEVNASRRTRRDRVLADARAAYVDQLDRWTLADVIDGA